LEDLNYRGHKLTVVYDKTGAKYKVGKGMMVFVDGTEKGRRDDIGPIKITGL
jgi:hypothetical protein